MHIRIGYDLVYDCPQPAPMLLVLNVHPSRIPDLVVPDRIATAPEIGVRRYRDGFGNECSRILAPSGRIRLSAEAVVRDSGKPDAIAPEAAQHPVEELPDDALVFLLASRYCETDHLSDTAWPLFGQTPPGWARVQAICDYVHRHLPSATSTRARPAPPLKPTMSASAFAATLPISQSRFAAA